MVGSGGEPSHVGAQRIGGGDGPELRLQFALSFGGFGRVAPQLVARGAGGRRREQQAGTQCDEGTLERTHRAPRSCEGRSEVGPLGFEPRFADPKSAVLPLDEGPVVLSANKLATSVLLWESFTVSDLCHFLGLAERSASPLPWRAL